MIILMPLHIESDCCDHIGVEIHVQRDLLESSCFCVLLRRKNFIDTFWQPIFFRQRKKLQSPLGTCLKGSFHTL